MNIRCSGLLLFFAVTAPITLFGASDYTPEISQKAADVLLKNDGVNTNSQEWKKKHDIVAWFWRNDNYTKPCKDKTFEKYRKQVGRIKNFQQIYNDLQKKKIFEWSILRKCFNVWGNNDIAPALEVYMLLPRPKALIDNLLQYLYKDIETGKRLLKPLKTPLKKSSFKIVDFKLESIIAYKASHKKIKPSTQGSYHNNNLNFFAKKDLIIIPCDGQQKIFAMQSLDGKALWSENMTDQTILKKAPETPAVWHQDGKNTKHIFTKNEFTLIIDPTNKNIEFRVENETIVSMECISVTQFDTDKTGIFVCAPTLYSDKNEQNPPALIIDFTMGHYFLLTHTYPQKLACGNPLYPEVICKNGIALINWHDQIDVLCPKTNSIMSTHSNYWLETMQLSPDGNRLLVCEKKSENKKKIDYNYQLIALALREVPIFDHIKAIASKIDDSQATFLRNFSGKGIGKTTTKIVKTLAN